jgi:hypothetical protein
MPYKDADQRRAAARKWRLQHRAERAAYMRRYRRARSSGRARGRPKSHADKFESHILTAEMQGTARSPETMPAPSSGPSSAAEVLCDPAPSSTPGNDQPRGNPAVPGREEVPPARGAACAELPDRFGFGIP